MFQRCKGRCLSQVLYTGRYFAPSILCISCYMMLLQLVPSEFIGNSHNRRNEFGYPFVYFADYMYSPSFQWAVGATDLKYAYEYSVMGFVGNVVFTYLFAWLVLLLVRKLYATMEIEVQSLLLNPYVLYAFSFVFILSLLRSVSFLLFREDYDLGIGMTFTGTPIGLKEPSKLVSFVNLCCGLFVSIGIRFAFQLKKSREEKHTTVHK